MPSLNSVWRTGSSWLGLTHWVLDSLKRYQCPRWVLVDRIDLVCTFFQGSMIQAKIYVMIDITRFS